MQSMYPKLAANPALFCTTEWTREVNRTDAVYTNHTRIKGLTQSKTSVDILREDAGHQTILGGI